jgi:hypothetical protein
MDHARATHGSAPAGRARPFQRPGRRPVKGTGSTRWDSTARQGRSVPDDPVPDPAWDRVTLASWESIPASDAPGWR